MITRRLALTSTGAAAAHRLVAQGKRELGLALYTLRDVLVERSPLEVLKRARAIGYTEVEIMRRQVASLVPHLKTVGLRPVSVHFETPLITGNWEAWREAEMPPIDQKYTFEKALEESASAGIPNMVFNYLTPKERLGLDFYRALSDKLNAAAEKCRAAGLGFWYHNHNFEFMPKAGGRPIDVLLGRLDRKLISLEVDLFWVSMAGVNPAEFVRENAARVVAVHLKDRARDTEAPKFDIASVPYSAFQEVGRGALNFREIFQAAYAANVRHYFVEQDHSSDPEASIERSYTAVRKLGF